MNTGAVNQVSENSGIQQYDSVKNKNERTVGSPKLSDKAQKYYEELQKKFSNMDFVLVDDDNKENAESEAAKFARTGRTQVLINEEKLERMAEDEAYRKKYEGIITNAQLQLTQVQSKLGDKVSDIKSFGIRVDDNGNASLFAVIDKSLAEQRERIEKKAEQKSEDKKKAEKKEQQERYEEYLAGKNDDFTTVTSDTADGLLQKINNIYLEFRGDNIQTESEKMVGRNIDYKS